VELEQRCGGRAGPERGVGVALDVRGDDRALNEQHQSLGQYAGLGDVGLGGHIVQQRAQRTLVAAGDSSCGRTGGQLAGHIDESAAVVAGVVEPAMQRVEHSQHASRTRLGGGHRATEPVEPALVPAPQVGLDQALSAGRDTVFDIDWQEQGQAAFVLVPSGEGAEPAIATLMTRRNWRDLMLAAPILLILAPAAAGQGALLAMSSEDQLEAVTVALGRGLDEVGIRLDP